MWSTRIVHEQQIWSEAGYPSSFVTLTYADEYLPTDYGLQKGDLQNFIKRLRSRKGRARYFAVGEYGARTLRPHYHMILFGHDFGDDRIEVGRNEFGDIHYWSPELEEIWGMGQTRIGAVTKTSAEYCAKYCVEKKTGEAAREHYKRTQDGYEWEVAPERAWMSLKPGIGESWFKKYYGDVYPSDEVIVAGHRVKTPRYYDTLWEREMPTEMEKIKRRRRVLAVKAAESLTPDRLEAREHIIKAQKRQKGHM